MARWPGPGAERGPSLLPPVPRGPPGPAPPAARPRRPAAAAATATARLSRDRPAGGAASHVMLRARRGGRAAPSLGSPPVPSGLAPLRRDTKTREGCSSFLVPGRAADGREQGSRRGSDESRKPGHPSLSLPSNGMGRLRLSVPLGLARESREG